MTGNGRDAMVGAASEISSDPKQADANARLIAAAPFLLAAHKETLRQLNAPDCPELPDGAMIRGRIMCAIAAAEGRQS